MIWHNFKLAFRNIVRDKWISPIKVIGLSLGLTSIVILGSYISIELKRGTQISNYKDIYSLQPKDNSSLSNPMVDLFRNEIPEINELTAFRRAYFDKAKFSFREQVYQVSDIILADSLFFEVFNFPVIYGNLKYALEKPNAVVLTNKIAQALFGKSNPIGEQILLKATGKEDILYEVTAVIENTSEEAMFQFESIFSINSLRSNPYFEQNMAHWGNCNFSAFFTLINQEATTAIEEKANASFQRVAPKWIKEDGRGFVVKPYGQLYFDSESGDGMRHGNSIFIKFLGAVGLLILIVSWINYINLTLAKEEGKSQSNSIRKFLGANAWSVVSKGVIEMIPSLLFAVLLSFFLISILLPGFNNITGMNIRYSSYFSLSNLAFLLSIIIISLVVCGIFAGLYQAYLLHKKRSTNNKASFIRKSLIVLQFTVSTLLLILTLSVIKQFKYMQNKSMGFKSENIIHIDMLGELEGQQNSFKEELLKIPGISDATFASSILGEVYQHWGMSLYNNGESSRVGYNAIIVDKNYFDFYGLRIIEGISFLENSLIEKHHVFNQKAMDNFGIEDISKARITSYDNARGDIIGVVNNFNFQKLNSPVTNIGFQLGDPEDLSYLFLKTNPMSSVAMKSLLSKIENKWKEFVPDWPLEYGFQDKTLKLLYEDEMKFSKLFILAAVIAMLIACIGLLGVSIFTAERKTKEIGIRKVNDAKITEIHNLLNKSIIIWISLAFVIASPIAFYAMKKWLENFAYKAELSWWIFAFAGVLALGIALLTVSLQSWRAAMKNPVEALRYE